MAAHHDDTAASVAARPIALRMRRDLQTQPITVRDQTRWVVKDPVSASYFQLRPEEYWLLQQLDGRQTWQQIKQSFEKRFPGTRLNYRRLEALLATFYREGLLLAEKPGQGGALLERMERQRRTAWLERAGSLLAIKTPGVDPTSLIEFLYPRLRWLFSPAVLAAACLLVVSSLVLVVTQFQEIVSQLPTIAEWFRPHNLCLAIIALSLAKGLHELSHAMTCRHVGGECREIGIMWLVFAPCLYCDISDTWMIPSKWQRIAVALAGVAVEVVLASVAALLWYASEPGLFRMFCLNLVVVCGVSSLVFNLNPLLRYDGYYALADALEIPNLWSESRMVLVDMTNRWFYGTSRGEPAWLTDGRRVTLLTYGLLSVVYRCCMIGVILLAVVHFFRQYRLESVGWVLAAGSLTGLAAPITIRAARQIANPTHHQPRRRLRNLVMLSAVALIAAALAMVPIPYRVTGPVRVDVAGGVPVYVSVPGILRYVVRPGDVVFRGQRVAQLDNIELRRKLEQLDGDLKRKEIQLQLATTLAAVDPESAAAIPALREAVADLQDRTNQLRQDVERLQLVAPRSGVVWPPEPRHEPPSEIRLASWTGTPLDATSEGASLEVGTCVAWVGDPMQLEAVVAIDQRHVEYVRPGQRASIVLDQYPSKRFSGHVAKIARVERRVTYSGEDLRDTGGEQFHEAERVIYEVRVPLTVDSGRVLVSARGKARIATEPMSLVTRLYRAMRATFAF